jgi:6-phosphogluconolactonase
MTQPELKVLPDPDALAHEAADRIITAAQNAIETKHRFTIALSGGSTPKALYTILASDAYRKQIDWPRVEMFFGDERCVPPDDPESNFRMAKEAMLSKIPIPGDNIYRMRGEIEPEQAAIEYGRMLKDKFGDGGLDLVLLGIGEDGHTLSLFPGTKAVTETHHRVVANYAEHSTTGKSWRITMTAPFINESEQIFVLAAGAAKAKILSEVLEGPRDPDRLPIQYIQPAHGKIIWLLDAAAAGMGEGE